MTEKRQAQEIDAQRELEMIEQRLADAQALVGHLQMERERVASQIPGAALVPENAQRIGCRQCGQYMGYVTKSHGIHKLHRPDKSTITGHAVLRCICGAERVWQYTKDKRVK